MRANVTQLILLGVSLVGIAACAAPATLRAVVTASPVTVTVSTVPPTPTNAAPTAIAAAPTAMPLTPTLTLSLLAAWDAPTANHLAWFPDGTRLAVSSARGVFIYDAATLHEQRFLDVGQSVGVVAISGDGQTLAAALAAGGVELWDLRRGERLANFDPTAEFAELAGITDLVFSPDDRRLAVTGGSLSLWDIASGHQLRQWSFESGVGIFSPPQAVISRDGRLLAATALTATWIIDVDSGALLHHIDGLAGVPTRLAFSLDSRVLVGAHGSRLSFWDVASGVLRRERTLSGIAALSLSRDGLRLAGAGDGFIALSDAVTGQPRLRLMGHTGYAQHLAYSPNGTRFAALDANGTLWVWQVDIGRVVATLDRHSPLVTDPALSADGQALAWGSGQRVWLWDIASGDPPRPAFSQPDLVTNVAFSPDGRWLVSGGAAPYPRRASGGATAAARVWDLATGRLRDTLPSQGYAVSALAFTADSQTIATGGEDTIIRLWDIETGQLRRELRGFQTSPAALAFTPDGQQLLALALPFEGCYEGCEGAYLPWREEPEFVRLWDTASGQLITVVDTSEARCAFELLTLRRDGGLFAANLCADLGLWRLPGGQEPMRLRLPGPLRRLAFSWDGRLIAGLHQRTVLLVDSHSGGIIATAQTEQPLDWLTFLPNGRLLAWSDSGDLLRLWHARLGRTGP